MFFIDTLINNFPCISIDQNNFYLEGTNNYLIQIYKLDNIYYDVLYLRKLLPYIIEFNKVTKEYYLINRDYEYVGFDNIHYIKFEKPNDWSRIYLFNGVLPWRSKSCFKKYVKQYQKEKINNSLETLLINNRDDILDELNILLKITL